MAEQLTLFSAASPANRTASQVGVMARMIAAISGRNSNVSLASYDPARCYWKMSPGLHRRTRWQMSHDPLTHSQLLLTLPLWGMTRSGALYLLPTPERLISANGGGAWPTPQSRDKKNVSRPDAPRNQRKLEQGWSFNLNELAVWSTPAAQDGKNASLPPSHQGRNTLPGDVLKTMLPTPRAADESNRSVMKPGWDAMLCRVVKPRQNMTEIALNPEWVEQLMGLPRGWTDCDGPPDRTYLSTDGKRRARLIKARCQQANGMRASRRSATAASGGSRTRSRAEFERRSRRRRK